MTGRMCCAVGAMLAFVSTPAVAQTDALPGDGPSRWIGSEVAIGLLQHGVNFHPLGGQLIFDRPKLPGGQIYEGSEEDGTIDGQLVLRSPPLQFPLKPRLTAKLQINTAGRTSFASLGAEWRQHALKDRLYGQIGFGLTVQDGYRFTPDPFETGLGPAEARQRYDIYVKRTAFGSRVLFNPNAAVGVRLSPRWAIEATWEHYSHGQVFSEQNPGIDSLGLRLTHMIGSSR